MSVDDGLDILLANAFDAEKPVGGTHIRSELLAVLFCHSCEFQIHMVMTDVNVLGSFQHNSSYT